MVLDGESFFQAKDPPKNPHPSPLCCNNKDLLYLLFSPQFPPPVLGLPIHKLNDGTTLWFGGAIEAHPPILGDIVPNTVTLNLLPGRPNGGQESLILCKTATEKKTNTTSKLN